MSDLQRIEVTDVERLLARIEHEERRAYLRMICTAQGRSAMAKLTGVIHAGALDLARRLIAGEKVPEWSAELEGEIVRDMENEWDSTVRILVDASLDPGWDGKGTH